MIDDLGWDDFGENQICEKDLILENKKWIDKNDLPCCEVEGCNNKASYTEKHPKYDYLVWPKRMSIDVATSWGSLPGSLACDKHLIINPLINLYDASIKANDEIKKYANIFRKLKTSYIWDDKILYKTFKFEKNNNTIKVNEEYKNEELKNDSGLYLFQDANDKNTIYYIGKSEQTSARSGVTKRISTHIKNIENNNNGNKIDNEHYFHKYMERENLNFLNINVFVTILPADILLQLELKSIYEYKPLFNRETSIFK